MSLATTGGGAGLSGAGLSTAAMAHNTAPALLQQPQYQQQAHTHIPTGGGPSGLPVTNVALGADLLDKNQKMLSGKGVRGAARMPIVAVDLWGEGEGVVSYFPPVKDEDDEGNDEMSGMMRTLAKMKEGVKARSISTSSTDGNITFGVNEKSYKAVKKYLTKGEGHGLVLSDAITDAKDGEVLTLPHPHLLMGARNLSDLSPAAKSVYKDILPKSNGSSLAIDVNTSSPLSLTTIALDGNSEPKGDDFDRVVFQMRLNPKKKVMTILPEEAVGLLIAQCRKSVQEAYCKEDPESELNPADNEEEEEGYMDYPPAFAIPGWATMDSTLEALIDAAKGACGPSLHQRSIAACVGALLPPPVATSSGGGKQPFPSSNLNKLLTETMQRKDAEASKEAAKEAALNKTDPVEPDPFVPLVILAGVTANGIELTAVQISKPQGPDKELHCPFGNISVISSVCHSHADPLSLVDKTLDELRAQVGVMIPESEEPTAIVSYGSIGSQVKLAAKIKSILQQYGKDGQGNDDWDGWDQDIPIVSTKEDCVSMGLAVLAASVHGRVHLVVSVKGTDGKNRSKAKLAVSVQDVATSAVAVSFNYFGGDNSKWTEPKVIFDFDRRVPAGPYQIDFTAAECAAHVKHCTKNKSDCCINDEQALIEQTHNMEGFGGIPDREAAALQLRFRVYQKTERNGDWIRCGDDMSPLSMQHSQKEEDELVACESAVMELSLNPVGLITNSLITNGETIVQANKSALNSKLLRWAGIMGSIAFIGGFLIKSYVEEKIFERDTQRVMAFYKHAAPNSFHDGDERQARYLVWKYKGKKDALWRRLEAKYGQPVRHAWEWDDEEEEEKKEDKQEEADDLDVEGEDQNNGEEL
ncbi:hypothetical protein ACHAWO_009817 [Cyclotella atomus]|uniref:Transmembrane protein n=1 Tax=Cyclotella atomus TaxID=382360 RepID=A0ABD3QJB5_9STRA